MTRKIFTMREVRSEMGDLVEVVEHHTSGQSLAPSIKSTILLERGMRDPQRTPHKTSLIIASISYLIACIMKDLY
jgi:hypothetical protein